MNFPQKSPILPLLILNLLEIQKSKSWPPCSLTEMYSLNLLGTTLSKFIDAGGNGGRGGLFELVKF